MLLMPRSAVSRIVAVVGVVGAGGGDGSGVVSKSASWAQRCSLRVRVAVTVLLMHALHAGGSRW